MPVEVLDPLCEKRIAQRSQPLGALLDSSSETLSSDQLHEAHTRSLAPDSHRPRSHSCRVPSASVNIMLAPST